MNELREFERLTIDIVSTAKQLDLVKWTGIAVGAAGGAIALANPATVLFGGLGLAFGLGSTLVAALEESQKTGQQLRFFPALGYDQEFLENTLNNPRHIALAQLLRDVGKGALQAYLSRFDETNAEIALSHLIDVVDSANQRIYHEKSGSERDRIHEELMGYLRSIVLTTPTPTTQPAANPTPQGSQAPTVDDEWDSFEPATYAPYVEPDELPKVSPTDRETLLEALKQHEGGWLLRTMKLPCFLVVGEQGSGKTETITTLAAFRKIILNHQVEINDPHAHTPQNANRYTFADRVFGHNYDYDRIVERYYKYRDRLVTRNKPPYTTVWDEVTNYADHLPKEANFILQALSDNRKAQEYFILGSHSDNLGTLGGTSRSGGAKMIEQGLPRLYLWAKSDQFGDPHPTGKGVLIGLEKDSKGNPVQQDITIPEWFRFHVVSAILTPQGSQPVEPEVVVLETEPVEDEIDPAMEAIISSIVLATETNYALSRDSAYFLGWFHAHRSQYPHGMPRRDIAKRKAMGRNAKYSNEAIAAVLKELQGTNPPLIRVVNVPDVGELVFPG